MLGLGMGELMLLALIGFFVIGPERLPGAVRSLADPRRAVREALKEVPQPLSVGEPRIRVRTRSRA